MNKKVCGQVAANFHANQIERSYQDRKVFPNLPSCQSKLHSYHRNVHYG